MVITNNETELLSPHYSSAGGAFIVLGRDKRSTDEQSESRRRFRRDADVSADHLQDAEAIVTFTYTLAGRAENDNKKHSKNLIWKKMLLKHSPSHSTSARIICPSASLSFRSARLSIDSNPACNIRSLQDALFIFWYVEMLGPNTFR